MDGETVELKLVGGDIFVDPVANCLCIESGGKVVEFHSIIDLNGLEMWFAEKDVEGWRYEESVN